MARIPYRSSSLALRLKNAARCSIGLSAQTTPKVNHANLHILGCSEIRETHIWSLVRVCRMECTDFIEADCLLLDGVHRSPESM